MVKDIKKKKYFDRSMSFKQGCAAFSRKINNENKLIAHCCYLLL